MNLTDSCWITQLEIAHATGRKEKNKWHVGGRKKQQHCWCGQTGHRNVPRSEMKKITPEGGNWVAPGAVHCVQNIKCFTTSSLGKKNRFNLLFQSPLLILRILQRFLAFVFLFRLDQRDTQKQWKHDAAQRKNNTNGS